MATDSFGLDAYIAGGRWTHHRLHDHHGSDSDIYIATSGPIGGWNEGTPIFYVIEDLYQRLVALESNRHVLEGFTLAAFIPLYFPLAAVIAGSSDFAFYFDAVIELGGSFTLAAVIQGGAAFGLDAVIV